MDDIVRQAMAKWPNVPHCYGWLGLDARGHWYMRDDRTQAAGPFAAADGGTPDSKGAVLRHDKLIDFIHRNYDCDDTGQWYFQNGPQRVYVELEATPWVMRIDDALAVHSHTGRVAQVRAALTDEQGRVYLDTDIGLGLAHTLDVGLAARAIESGLWPLAEARSSDLPQRFGYVRSPQAQRAGATAAAMGASANKKPA